MCNRSKTIHNGIKVHFKDIHIQGCTHNFSRESYFLFCNKYAAEILYLKLFLNNDRYNYTFCAI